jgi:DNA-binding GntR family transcriptional regulator
MSCGGSHFLPLPQTHNGSQAGRLADDIALAIHLGLRRPGDPLREMDLAGQHGVSRTIVRAALQRLEAQGLAESEPNRGARVRGEDAAAFDDLIELQAALTALAARMAARAPAPAALADMRHFLNMMEHIAAETGPAAEFHHQRVGFARALAAGAGETLRKRLEASAPAVPHHARALDDVADADGQAESLRLHAALFAAVAAGQPEAAAAAGEAMIRRHGERTRPAPEPLLGAPRAA